MAQRYFSNFSSILFLVGALAACGGADQGGDEGGGGRNGGGGRRDGTCARPLDFEMNFKEMGRIPFIEGDRSELPAEQVGSCGGLDSEMVIAWTAKRHGVIEIGPPGPNPDLILYARRSCEDPQSEIACSRGLRLPTFEVEEGETIYVIADSNGGASLFDVAFKFLPFLGEGEVCKPQETTGICGEGLRCKRDNLCAPNYPPTVTELLVAEVELEGTPSIKLRAYGEAPDRHTRWVHYTFLDEAGEVVLETKANIQQIQNEPEFWVGHRVERRHAEGAVSVVAQFEDVLGERGNSLERPIVQPPLRDEGEECDPALFSSVCRDGLFCESESNEPPSASPLCR